MSEQPGRRAAVLAMDAAGYSRAMSLDEHRALAALATSRTIIDRAIDANGGRVFSTGGDSVLAEFQSGDAAVACGVAIQGALADAAKRAIEVLSYRAGLHIGQVFPQGDDLLGETINIAARLESLANPGGICISDSIREDLDLGRPLRLEPMGLQVLKGIKRPIRVSRIRLGEPALSTLPATKIGVAVLPFRSAGNDEHWGEGLADELIAALSRFSDLSVRARPPRLAQGQHRDPRQTASELGVDYVVDGVLRVQLPRFRLSIQLIEGTTGTVVWSDRIGDTSSDLLSLEDRLVDLIGGMLPGRLSRANADIALRKGTESLGARDLFFQGLHHADKLDARSSRQALDCFEKAIAIDHDYAAALAMSALVRLRLWALDGSQRDLDPIAATAERALDLDPADSWSHLVLGQVTMYRKQLDVAEVHHKKAVALNPFDARILALRSPLATYLGKPDEGREWIERAIGINPYHPPWYVTNLGLCCYCAGHYEEGASAYLSVPHPQTGVLAGLVACCAQMGDEAGARSAAAKLREVQPDFSSAVFVAMRPFKFETDREHLLAGLRRGGLPA